MATVTFPRFFRAADFAAGTTATDISVTTGQFNQFGSKTVGAKQQIHFGVGVVTPNGTDTRETATIRMDSATGQIAGQFRLAVQDANGIVTTPVYENNHTNFGTGVPLGLSEPGAGEDSKLLLLIQPDSTTTIDYSDSDNNVNMPVTVINFV